MTVRNEGHMYSNCVVLVHARAVTAETTSPAIALQGSCALPSATATPPIADW